MAIRINRNGETIYGQYSSGDVIINLPPNQENLLLEGGIATLLDEGELQIVLAGSGGYTTFVSSPVSLPDLTAVGVATVPAPSTPANEYINATGAFSGTDGGSTWGGQQHRCVVMSDGTVFAAVLDSTNLLLMRSAAGGTYGSAWTTAATIANSGRNSNDLDAHLLRNPETDQVHLIASSTDGGISRYRIRTYSLAGTLVNDYFMPDTWIGSGNAAASGWFASTIAGTTKYSSAAIGADGTIAFVDSISTGTYLGVTYSERAAAKRMQLLRWNGATWRASQIYTYAIGPRVTYDNIAVSPPGREGYVVGIGSINMKVQDWNQYFNPNYGNGGTWVNSNADTSYFGNGRGPAIVRWEVSLNSPSTYSSGYLRAPDFATVDQSAATPANPDEYGAYTFVRARIDRAGRWWMQYTKSVRTPIDNFTFLFVCDPLGVPIYQIDRSTFYAGSLIDDYFFDARNRAWVISSSKGGTMNVYILSTTESVGALTVQTFGTATNQAAGGGTVLGANTITSRFEIFYSTRTPQLNNGSVPTNNWFDFIYMTPGDHTGTAPGTTIATMTDGAVKTKRVRITVPVT